MSIVIDEFSVIEHTPKTRSRKWRRRMCRKPKARRGVYGWRMWAASLVAHSFDAGGYDLIAEIEGAPLNV